MANGLRYTLAVTLDGVPVAGFPILRRIDAPNAQQLVFRREADGAGQLTTAAPLPVADTELLAVLLAPDGPLRLALNGQTVDGVTELPIGADGLLFAGPTSFLLGATQTMNPGAAAVTIRGVVAGR